MARIIENIAAKLIPSPYKNRIRQHVLSNIPITEYWKTLNLQFKLKSGLSIKVMSSGDWWVYNEIFVDHEYDLPIKMALDSAKQNRAFKVLDLGANVGFFTLRVFDLIHQSEIEGLAPQVTMVEGSPSVFKELELRISSQDISPDSVRLLLGLVGNRSGSACIYESDFHAKNTIVTNLNSTGISVNYLDLNPLYEHEAEIDLLKCDIEGAELMFLENYEELLCKTKTAVFELHHDKCDVDKCLKLLENAGFMKNKTLSSESTTSTRLFWKQ